MITDTRPWQAAYLAELERAAAVLPADRRSELLAQIDEHLQRDLADVSDAEEAQQVLQRLGDPYDVVAEAAADLPAPAPAPSPAGSTAAEIVALLLLGIGGFALPLIAPFVGVLVMLSSPRWTRREVRNTGLIVGLGVVAVVGMFVILPSGAPSAAAFYGSLALLAVMVLVGPAAALYAATRSR